LEWGTLYPAFAKTALKEGFQEAATAFTEIGEVEEKHEKRYRILLDRVKKGTVFKRGEEVEWKCRNCGYIHHGKEAPETCPACKHPRSYYELNCENY
jgi:rubrerythrin